MDKRWDIEHESNIQERCNGYPFSGRVDVDVSIQNDPKWSERRDSVIAANKQLRKKPAIVRSIDSLNTDELSVPLALWLCYQRDDDYLAFLNVRQGVTAEGKDLSKLWNTLTPELSAVSLSDSGEQLYFRLGFIGLYYGYAAQRIMNLDDDVVKFIESIPAGLGGLSVTIEIQGQAEISKNSITLSDYEGSWINLFSRMPATSVELRGILMNPTGRIAIALLLVCLVFIRRMMVLSFSFNLFDLNS